MLGFETLTFAPIDRRLIDVADARARGADLAQLLPRARAGEDRPDAVSGADLDWLRRPARRLAIERTTDRSPNVLHPDSTGGQR